MPVEKEKDNLEKLFLKSNEKDIVAKIQEKHSIKFFLNNLLKEETYLKSGILEVLELALKYNKVYVFNETWKKINNLTNPEFQLEIYRTILQKALVMCEKDSEILKIISNKIPLTLKELDLKVLSDAFLQEKTDNLIFFFEKRRLKKHEDLTLCEKELISASHMYNNQDLLKYFQKRKLNVFGNNYEHLKNAAISGKVDKLNFLHTLEKVSFKQVIDWSKEDVQPHEQSEKWLRSFELKEKLTTKLVPKEISKKEKVVKI